MRTAKKIIVCSFHNIRPVNSNRGHKRDCYCDPSHFFKNKTIRIRPARGEKTIYAVCFNEELARSEYIYRLGLIGKRPCRNAPNYLLGLMAQVPEKRMPAELRFKYICAAEPDNPFSIFADADSGYDDLVIYICRDNSLSGRVICLVRNVVWSKNMAFLAEDLPRKGKTP